MYVNDAYKNLIPDDFTVQFRPEYTKFYIPDYRHIYNTILHYVDLKPRKNQTADLDVILYCDVDAWQLLKYNTEKSYTKPIYSRYSGGSVYRLPEQYQDLGEQLKKQIRERFPLPE